MSSRHESLLLAVEQIDPLPTTVTKLSRVISEPDHDVREVVELVELDPVLTAALLRRANSALAASVTPVSTVKDAVVRVGTGPVLTLAFAATVGARMRTGLVGYGLRDDQLWQGAVAASVAADEIRAVASVEVPPEASTAALLHDFGKVVLNQYYGSVVFRMLQQAAATDEISLMEAERRTFGLTHAELGGVVAGKWRLPRSVIDGILHHHDTGSDQSPVAATVSLAHALIPRVLDADGAEPLDEEAYGPVLTALGIDEVGVERVESRARARYADIAGSYGLC